MRQTGLKRGRPRQWRRRRRTEVNCFRSSEPGPDAWRGREQGEVAKLLCQVVNDESPETKCRIVLDEIKALRSEMEGLREGKVIVVFYDQLEPVMKILQEVGAKPVSTIEEPKLVGVAPKGDTISALAI